MAIEKEEINQGRESAADTQVRIAAWAAGANDRAFAALREERNRKLDDSDWWVLSGSITEEQTSYRQALRDLPATTDDPANITFPVEP